MLANKLGNLAQLTRGAVRDVRQVVNELIEVLAPRPQPSLVRVPVRNGPRSKPTFRSPYSARHFSTSSSFRIANGTIFQHLKFKPRFFNPSSGLANKLWPYSGFRVNLMGKGPFPSGLYRNFVNLNARNFSTYGGSASREAVQNLTSSLRCMMNNGGDTLMSLKMTKKQDSSLPYHGCMTQKEAPETFKLARCESSNVERMGCYVEFLLPDMQLSIPSITFMNSEILSSLEMEFEQAKDQIDRTSHFIQQIFEAYGSLPLEKRDQSVRIHFPNLEAEELEKFLIELGIDEGVVYTSEEVDGTIEEASMTASSADLSDLVGGDYVPDLLSGSDSEDSCTESLASEEFFPALSSSSGYQFASPIELSQDSSPVVIAHSQSSFSEMSMSI